MQLSHSPRHPIQTVLAIVISTATFKMCLLRTGRFKWQRGNDPIRAEIYTSHV